MKKCPNTACRAKSHAADAIYCHLCGEKLVAASSSSKSKRESTTHDSLINEIVLLLEKGKTLKAIKLYRDATGVDWITARDIVNLYRPTSNKKSSAGCYIATAVYGSYDCPEVWTLRRYRDTVLANTWYGRLFIRCYYSMSPTLVKWLGQTSCFRMLLRNPLNKWVKKLNEKGFENTPYIDQKQ